MRPLAARSAESLGLWAMIGGRSESLLESEGAGGPMTQPASGEPTVRRVPEVRWETEGPPVHSNHVVLQSGPDGFLLHFCEASRPPEKGKPHTAIVCASVHMSPQTFFEVVALLVRGWNQQAEALGSGTLQLSNVEPKE